MKQAQAGFTLIEILVVMVILAVITSVASLGFGRGSHQRFNSSVEQSRQWLQHIATEAVLSGAIWAVIVNEQEMQAYVWNGQDWLRSADNPGYSLPENTHYSHTVETDEDADEDKPQPHFTLFPTGQIMPPEDILISDDENRAILTWKESFSPEVVYQ